MTTLLPPAVVLFTNSPAMGGMEQHVLVLASGYVGRGIRAGVVCSPRPEIAPLRDALAAAGVAVHTPPERRGALGVRRRIHDLTEVFRRYPGGVLHVHSTGFHGGDLVLLAGKLARMAAIVRTEHVPPQPPVGLANRVHVRLRDRFLLDTVICVSSSNRDEHIELLGRNPGKITVVPNGIDVDRFAGADGAGLHAELGLAPGVRLVGVVARLSETRKGIVEFLRMAAVVAPDHPDAHFLVVGDGPLRGTLERLAGKLGLGERVTFLGPRDDVERVMADMHVFVMPSLWEAGPLTLLEAMALGKPVVTTSVGVVPDAVTTDVNGLVVPPGDVDALAAAVSRLLGDDALAARLGAAAQAEALRSFSGDHMVDRTLAVYASAMGLP